MAGLVQPGPGRSITGADPSAHASHLHMQLRPAVEEVKEPLVVEELGIPLLGLVIPEVIAQRHKEDIASEKPGLLPVLVQEQGCPGNTEGHRPNMKSQT